MELGPDKPLRRPHSQPAAANNNNVTKAKGHETRLHSAGASKPNNTAAVMTR